MTENQPVDEPLYAPSDVIDVLDRISEILSTARSMPMSATVFVNKAEVEELLSTAREALPADVVRADRIVGDAEAVLDRADAEASQTIGDAETYAKTTRSDADAYAADARHKADDYAAQARKQADTEAEEIVRKSKELGRGILDKARAEEERIIEQAKQRAEQLVCQETIYREAVSRGEVQLASARQKAEQRSAEADRYVASQLEHLEEQATQIAHQARAGREKVQRS